MNAISQIPVVCEYQDVFPEELPGMPPHRPVEFVIELEPGTEPVCKRPYKLSKVAHFLPIKESITAAQLAELYTSRIVSLHGIPQLISSDRGGIFTSKFWDSFQRAMGTNIRFSTAFHLKLVAKSSESIQFLKICSGLVSFPLA